ncbi:MAG: hypothetical protein R2867_44560 [Caldilineaceae bacterium]
MFQRQGTSSQLRDQVQYQFQPFRWIAPVVCVLILAGCGRFSVSTTVERMEPPTATALPATATPSPAAVTGAPVLLATPVPVNAPAVVDAGLTLDASYRDETVGLALDYPSDWTITELSAAQKAQSQSYATVFHSWVSGPDGGDGIPEGGTKFDLVVTSDGSLTLDRALAALQELYPQPESDNELLGTEPLTLASGLPAMRVQTKSVFGESSYILAVINGHQVILGGVGDQAVVEQIAQTLRPLTTEGNTNPNVVTARLTDVPAIRVVGDMVPVYSGPGETFRW